MIWFVKYLVICSQKGNKMWSANAGDSRAIICSSNLEGSWYL